MQLAPDLLMNILHLIKLFFLPSLTQAQSSYSGPMDPMMKSILFSGRAQSAIPIIKGQSVYLISIHRNNVACCSNSTFCCNVMR